MAKKPKIAVGNIVTHVSRPDMALRVLIVEEGKARCENAFRKPKAPAWFSIAELKKADSRPMKVWLK